MIAFDDMEGGPCRLVFYVPLEMCEPVREWVKLHPITGVELVYADEKE